MKIFQRGQEILREHESEGANDPMTLKCDFDLECVAESWLLHIDSQRNL